MLTRFQQKSSQPQIFSIMNFIYEETFLVYSKKQKKTPIFSSSFHFFRDCFLAGAVKQMCDRWMLGEFWSENFYGFVLLTRREKLQGETYQKYLRLRVSLQTIVETWKSRENLSSKK